MKYPALGFFVLLICGLFAVPSSAIADDYAGICATMVDGISTGKSVYLSVQEGQLTGYVQTGSLLGRIPIEASVGKSGRFRAKIAKSGGSGFVSGKVRRSKIIAQGYVESKKTGRVRLFINVPPRLLRGNLPIIGDYTALQAPSLKSGYRLYVEKSPDAGDDEDYYDMRLMAGVRYYLTWNHVKITNNEGIACIVSSYAGIETRSYFYFEFQGGRIPGVNRVFIDVCQADGSSRGASWVCYPF